MRVYILRDDDPLGGFYSAQETAVAHLQTAEVRECDIPRELWDSVMTGSVELGEDGTLDHLWYDWFEKGTVVWERGT